MLIVFDLDDTLFDCSGQMKYETRWQDVKGITSFSGVQEFLRSFPAKKMLLTCETDKGLQNMKINTLGIRAFFDEVLVCYSNKEKKQHLANIKRKYPDEEICVIGDRIDVEIQFGNELGLKTIRVLHGKYKDLFPQNRYQQPDYCINQFSQLNEVLKS